MTVCNKIFTLFTSSQVFFVFFYKSESFFFLQIRKLNFDCSWSMDMLYYPTFLIHQNVCTDLTYMSVLLKIKHIVKYHKKNWRRGRNFFFFFYNLQLKLNSFLYMLIQNGSLHTNVFQLSFKTRKDQSCRITFKKYQKNYL